jgi:hypothetical protein
MVAGLLNICGLYLGNNLLGKMPSNKKGHFEDRHFLQINDDLLRSNGGSWDKPPEEVLFPNPAFTKRMATFIDRWPKTKVVGWKDPRACLTIHLWGALMNKDDLKVVYVGRPADEVAASLAARNNFEPGRSHALIGVYAGRFLRNIKAAGCQWITTGYSAFFGRPFKELRQITDFLGLRLPGDHTQIRNFIDPNLRHHKELR